MKRVYLQRFHQFGTDCFSGTADARILAGMSRAESEDTQLRYQRSLKLKKVQEITHYVADEHGLIPGSVILGTRFADKVIIKEFKIPNNSREDVIHYTEFPETESELEAYQGTLDIMDGQHRLLAFSKDFITLAHEMPYELPFNIYITPSVELKRTIFMAANEKQDKVDSNLLQWYRSELGKMEGDETTYLEIIKHLNDDEDSPLSGRIILSDEKIVKGYKAMQLIKIFRKIHLLELRSGDKELDAYDLSRISKIYLHAWENACEVSFVKPLVGDTITKIAGIRYMLHILPTIWAFSLAESMRFNSDFVEAKIALLAEAVGVANPVLLFRSRDLNFAFRGEGATAKLAQLHIEKLKAFDIYGRNSKFNPLGD